jgi:hypothetical protein
VTSEADPVQVVRLRADVAMEQAESRRLLESLRQAQEQCSAYARDLESTYAEREELLYLRKQCESVMAEITVRRMELVALRTELEAVHRANADLHVLYMHNERQLTAMQQSVSWRLTRPCRAVRRVLYSLIR